MSSILGLNGYEQGRGMDYEEFFRDAIGQVKAEGRYRVFAELERHAGKFPHASKYIGDQTADITVWCSNDYLGMGQHPKVLAAMKQAVDKVGVGSGGTRNIAGTSHHHVLLERELSSLHRTEAALLFTSGYVANEGALSTLASNIPDCVILSDAYNHASMIAGIRHSRAERRIFEHNSVDNLQLQLSGLPQEQPKIIVFESV